VEFDFGGQNIKFFPCHLQCNAVLFHPKH
jgi:hypothetical protein